MKIILFAFNKLQSEFMDVPEETGTTFKLALTQKPQAIVNYSGDKIKDNPLMETICEFEWTGDYLSTSEGEARRYVLRDIFKQ